MCLQLPVGRRSSLEAQAYARVLRIRFGAIRKGMLQTGRLMQSAGSRQPVKGAGDAVTRSHKLDPVGVELFGWNLHGKRRPASRRNPALGSRKPYPTLDVARHHDVSGRMKPVVDARSRKPQVQSPSRTVRNLDGDR